MNRKFLLVAALLALALSGPMFPVYAQTTPTPAVTTTTASPDTVVVTSPDAVTVPDAHTVVTFPVDDWTNKILPTLGLLITAVVLYALRKLPAPIASILGTLPVEQILKRAVDFAINAVGGATKGKKLTFDTGNEVVNRALQYVVDNAPAWLIKFMGGEDMIRQKIIARLDLDETAMVVDTVEGGVAIAPAPNATAG